MILATETFSGTCGMFNVRVEKTRVGPHGSAGVPARRGAPA